MKRTRRVLRAVKDSDDGFIFTIDEDDSRTFIEGCWLELHFALSELEYWNYAKRFPTGRSCRTTVCNNLRLTYKGHQEGSWHIVVAVRPKDADAKYRSSDVKIVAKGVESDFEHMLRSTVH